ncbi:RNA polymerase factor sigma-54 [Falsiroseomonas selenitidurans]|uniref:RNA polymerase sigma-54 factor n=1 Tax=Falsiroseomonas selenitidurans TaxID=2716335 RepID=A0ABX1E1M2_9PROT|nr:RNA polymerase factor sigma-54 [Falsiroseomonas selenitidurans]NKC29708.1 RNA polymerase factor sigma-54 [Falsiroseomonas selenitidurans]
MALGPRLDLRQSQSLVMTPQLRQAIKLLQSSNVEVTAFVEEELERNPLLERDERPEPRTAADERAPEAAPAEPLDAHAAATSTDLPTEGAAPLDADWGNVYDGEGGGYAESGGRGGRADFDESLSDIEDLADGRKSLREHLGEQVRLTFGDARERLIAAQMLALVDPAGRLAITDAQIATAMGCPEAQVAAVRARLQRLDPVGMFCRDLRECLAVQLADRNRLDPCMDRLLDNLEMLARRDLRGLMRVCEVDQEDLTEMVAELRRLDPKPGASFDAPPAMAVVPDVLMRRMPDGGWAVELNPETLPRILVNRGFHARAVVGAKSRDDKAFIADRLQSATWLVKSLEQRANTILKVAAEIVRRQDGFFRHGVAHLRPLILRDVAEYVAMHESTVSRVTANKYIATPRGTFELKYFFTTAIAGTLGGEAHSAEAVRFRIREMIGAETCADVLSDDAIVERLRKEGVDIARRTVAKYREALRIPSSVQRKREKAVPA